MLAWEHLDVIKIIAQRSWREKKESKYELVRLVQDLVVCEFAQPHRSDLTTIIFVILPQQRPLCLLFCVH